MELPCQECGNKNPMGVIFCRECGAKIEMDNLQPKVVVSSEKGRIKFTKLAIRRLISLVVSIIIFGCIALLFMDGSPAYSSAATDKEVENVEKFYDRLVMFQGEIPKKRLKNVFILSEDSLSAWMTNELTEQNAASGEATLVYKEVIFKFPASDKISIDLRAEMNVAGMKTDITCRLLVSFSNEDGVEFTVLEGAHGKVSLPEFAYSRFVIPRMEALIPNQDDVEQLIDQLKSLEIIEDKLKVSLKKKPVKTEGAE